MQVTLPVPVGRAGPPAGSGLTWIEIGVGANPARTSALLAASGSPTKCATWSRKISLPTGSRRSTSIARESFIECLFALDRHLLRRLPLGYRSPDGETARSYSRSRYPG